MRKLILAFFTLLGSVGFAQFNPGDMAFVAFNADGNDNFAIVTFKTIPASSTVYFRDDEWNGVTLGNGGAFADQAESYLTWNTGANDIAAGTVILFDNVSAPSISVSVGTVTLSGPNAGVSGTSDAIFCYSGSDFNTPSRFIAAIANDAAAFGNLQGTGLAVGSTAVVLTTGTDIGQYKGLRAGFTQCQYVALLNDVANTWDIQDASGDQSIDAISPDVPFNNTAFSLNAQPVIALTTSGVLGNENLSTTFIVTATAAAPVTSNQSVPVLITGNGITSNDYTLSSVNIVITNGTLSGAVTLNISDDTELEGTEYFRVSLAPSFCYTLGAVSSKDHILFDNDFPAAPVANNAIQLNRLSSFSNGATGSNSAEISAYDAGSKRLFIVNSVARKLNIVDMSDPLAMSLISTIDIAPYGGINSVAVHNGIVAAAIEATNLTDNGLVLFFNTDGVLQKQVIVGAMPDMVTFSPNGNLVLTANEGEPSDDYLTDPEGTVSIIDISGGVANVTQSNVVTANFNAFDSQAATLRSQGVRIYGANNASVSKDFEPEYISFSEDGNTAYVTLQENNAIAELNVATGTFTTVRALGLKDHNLLTNGLDASDQSGAVLIGNLPVKGMYQPDAIASYTINNETYLITANEGDSRVYPRTGTATFNEEVRVGATGYVLDPTVFPNAALLKNNSVLGRLQLTNRTGDIDGDGDFDEIHALGARSFSIWKPTSNGISQLFDSKDQLERITASNATYFSIFNASNDAVTPVAKNRSDNKGPEPEGVVLGKLAGKTYAFVGLERIGGVMVYDVTNPAAPVFVQWANNRSTTSAVGDLGTEGLSFVPAAESPTGVPLVILSNEISSTVSVYAISGTPIPTPPTNFVASKGNNQQEIALSWIDNTNTGTGVEIFRSTNELTGFEKINTLDISTTSLLLTNQTEGTTYYFKIRAFNDFGYSDFTAVQAIQLVPKPTAVDATEITFTTLKANWNAVADATGYEFDLSTDNFITFVTGYNSKAVTSTTESITGLTSGTAYSYRVRAVKGAYSSVNSNVIAVSTVAETRIISITNELDYGTVIIGETPPTRSITVKNTGNSALNISAITYPEGFTSTTAALTLSPDQSANVTITFTPTQSKNYSGNVLLTSNATGGASTWPIVATGVLITAIEPVLSPSASPNPSTGKFQITAPESWLDAPLSLRNLNGIVISFKQERLSANTLLVDITDQASGLYVLHLQHQNRIKTIKLIKIQ